MTGLTGIVGLIITNIHELHVSSKGGLAGAGRREPAPQSNQISSSLRDIDISHFYDLERACPGKAEAGKGEETHTQTTCTDQTGIVWRIIIYTVPDSKMPARVAINIIRCCFEFFHPIRRIPTIFFFWLSLRHRPPQLGVTSHAHTLSLMTGQFGSCEGQL